jgi:hypothetical protein
MTLRSTGATRAVQVLVSVAAIAVGNLASIGWLSLLGMISLGLVIASAVYRRRDDATLFPNPRGLMTAVIVSTIAVAALMALLIIQPGEGVMFVAVALALAGVVWGIGSIVWWLIRLNQA